MKQLFRYLYPDECPSCGQRKSVRLVTTKGLKLFEEEANKIININKYDYEYYVCLRCNTEFNIDWSRKEEDIRRPNMLLNDNYISKFVDRFTSTPDYKIQGKSRGK